MKINVTVDEVTLETVVHEASEYGPGATVADLVAAQIVERVVRDGVWTSFRDRVTEIRDEEIRAGVQPLIAEALASPMRRTNSYGEATGPETTLRQIIADEARRIVTKPADSYSSKRSILQEIVHKQVRETFAGEVADEVAKARKSVSGKLGEMVAAAIDEGMRRR